MNPRHNFGDLRTIGYSLAVGALVGSLLGGSVLIGVIVWLVVYGLAAVSDDNRSTCGACGAGLRPQASVCHQCNAPVVRR